MDCYRLPTIQPRIPYSSVRRSVPSSSSSSHNTAVLLSVALGCSLQVRMLPKGAVLSVICLSICYALTRAKTNECGTSKLTGCFCGKIYMDGHSKFAVNCTDTGFMGTSMLEDLPEQTQILIFTGNHIPVLDTNVFGDKDLSALEVIDMTNNHICEIKGKAFHHVLGVRRLILNHNNITIADQEDGNYHHRRVFSNFYNLEELHLTNAFADNTDAKLANDLHDIFVNSNLTKLYKLHLEQNEIRTFKDMRVFCDLPDIHDIYLAENNIQSLNFNITCMRKLRYLDLEENNITKFTQEELDTFDKMTRPRHEVDLMLALQGNPFRCDAAIKTLYNWLKVTKVEVRDKNALECHQAKNGVKYITNLKMLGDARHTKISQALTVLMVILFIIIITLLASYVYLRKEELKTKLSPLIEAMSRKVQYTTIESQDV